MLKLIGAIFKYSTLVVVILVLSHIVEIKGVTVSKHVENALNFVGGFNPKQISKNLSAQLKDQYKKIDEIGSEASSILEKTRAPADAGVTAEDEKQLQNTIEKAKRK